MPRLPFCALTIVLGAISVTGTSTYASPAFRVLYNFCHDNRFVCSDGKAPAANVIRDSAGNLYGTTSAGGSTGNGVVFELVRSGGKYAYRVLHSFDGAADGGVPVTELIMDTAGNLYGTTTADGSNFGGTAFQLSPDANHETWTYKVLTNFCSSASANCVQGMVPESALTYAGAANGQPYDGVSPLYGTTLGGGPNGVGVAYQLTLSGGTWTGSLLYSFCSLAGCADGQFPGGQLALDAKGNLYGTTNAGGTGDGSAGVAYRIATGSGSENVIYNFCSRPSCTDGSLPGTGVTLDGRHTLFGATGVGGRHGSGTVYELNPATGKENVLYSFCKRMGCADGVGPTSPVIEYGGALIGTARGGNATSAGVVYRIGAANEETVLHTFCQEPDCTDGSLPVGVLADGNGNLFGATQAGGRKNAGVVYELKQ